MGLRRHKIKTDNVQYWQENRSEWMRETSYLLYYVVDSIAATKCIFKIFIG